MGRLIKSYSMSLVPWRISDRYPSLTGIIFWRPSGGRAPQSFYNKIGTQEPCRSRPPAWPVLKEQETNDRGSITPSDKSGSRFQRRQSLTVHTLLRFRAATSSFGSG